MKLHAYIPVMALLATLAVFPAVYADPSPAAAASSPAVAKAKSPRDEMLSQLPPEKAKAYQDAIDQLHAKNKPLHEQVDKLQQDISALMTADNFDKSAYLAKNAELNKTYEQMHANTAETIAGLAEKFTADERKILEKNHQSMMKRGDGYRSHGK